jgi:maltose O-acetyltransferase
MKRHLGMTLVGRVDIGNRVYIGERSIILPNVRVGDCAVIGAGSVVTRDVPPRAVVVGVPARQVEELDSYIERHREQMQRRPTWRELRRPDVSEETIREMREKLADGPGYVP